MLYRWPQDCLSIRGGIRLPVAFREFVLRRRAPNQVARLDEEKKLLGPLPPREDAIICTIGEGPVSKLGTLRIQRCKASYSVPDEAIGKMCRFVVSAFDVKIYEHYGEHKLICVHGRKPEGEHSILLEHVLPSLCRKPGAMARWVHREILFPDSSFRRYYRFLKKRDPDSAERKFLKAVNLVQYTPLAEIGIGMDLVVEADCPEPFDELKQIVLAQGHRPEDPGRPFQSPIEPDLTAYDSLIPSPTEEAS